MEWISDLELTTIRVTWRYVAPSVEEEPLTGYKVRYWESDQDVTKANDTIVLIGNSLEATIDTLTPGKSYYLRVLAFSQGGEGKMSSPVWWFQMGDPDQLNGAFSSTDSSIITTLLAVLIQFIVAKIVLSSTSDSETIPRRVGRLQGWYVTHVTLFFIHSFFTKQSFDLFHFTNQNISTYTAASDHRP